MGVSVITGLKEAFQAEIIENYICDHCEQIVRIKRSKEIVSYPDIFLIRALRFNPNGDKNKEALFCDRSFRIPDSADDSPQYTYSASINHIGNTVSAGHYTAVVSNSEHFFIEFSDEKVTDRFHFILY